MSVRDCLNETLWDLKRVIEISHGRVLEVWRWGRDYMWRGGVKSMQYFFKILPCANVMRVRESERAFVLWVYVAGSVYGMCVGVFVREDGWMDGWRLLSGNCFARPNVSPCHPCRRKKNRNERNWKKFWKRTTERSQKLRLSWYDYLFICL